MTDLLNVGERELRDILSRGSAWKLRDGIVRQARAAWERELAEVRRQAAWDALTEYVDECGEWTVGRAFALSFRDTHYAPTPRSVTLSDGSVVRVTLNGTTLERSMPDKYARTALVGQWASLLGVPTDTGADFDALKAFAASVEAK